MTRRQLGWTVLCALALSGCAMLAGVRPLSTARAGSTSFHSLRVDGRTRRFLLHLPPAAATQRVPLVLAFHGHHGNGAVLRAQSHLDAIADRLGFAVAYPDGTGRFGYLGLSWNAGTCCGSAHTDSVDDLTFTDSLIAALGRSTAVDVSRVFATGFSVGGMLALRLACERAATFLAVADVQGAMPDVACTPSRPVAVLLIQGGDDDELRFDLQTLPRPAGYPFAHSLEHAFAFWSHVNACTAEGAARDSQPAAVRLRATDCPQGRAVELMTVAGHPHAWPGGDRTWRLAPRPAAALDASRTVLEFFRDIASDTRAVRH
jgi:polyhydroxybutyrate depolymerase